MGNWNRIWLFFVIVAIGLVLSWGQLAHKAEMVRVDGILLDTETPCRPYLTPCAAYGTDTALVLGPGEERDLILKVAAQSLPNAVAVSLVSAGQDSRREPISVEAYAAGVWRLHLANDLPERAHVLIELSGSSINAIFPLEPH